MKNYTIVPNEVITATNINPKEKNLLLNLYQMAFGQKTSCFPSQGYLAKLLKVSVRTIQRWLNKLKLYGYINIIRRGHKSNIYQLNTKKDKQNVSDKKDIIPETDIEKKYSSKKNNKEYNYVKKQAKKDLNFLNCPSRNYDFDVLENMLLGYEEYDYEKIYKK